MVHLPTAIRVKVHSPPTHSLPYPTKSNRHILFTEVVSVKMVLNFLVVSQRMLYALTEIRYIRYDNLRIVLPQKDKARNLPAPS